MKTKFKKTNPIFNAKLFALFLSMIFISGLALAAHTTTVTISPGAANCSIEGNTFTVHIINDESSSDNIAEVRIYEGTIGLDDFACGDAPEGWAKAVTISQGYGYCEYKETPGGNNDKIAPGESLDFTFVGRLREANVVACNSAFLISSLDDAQPTGQHQYASPVVFLDCTPPQVDKLVGQPSIVVDNCEEQTYSGLANAACDYWATQNTPFSFNASESTDLDVCNLGFDAEQYPTLEDGYCKFRYTVNAVTSDWISFESEGPMYEFISNYNFPTDSEHTVEIECVDIAGNITTVTETDIVETVEPDLNKFFTGPQKIDGKTGAEWIEPVDSRVVIDAVDPEPHQSEVFKTYWRNDLLGPTWSEYEYDACYNPSEYCNLYRDYCADAAIADCQYDTDNLDAYLSCLDTRLQESCNYNVYEGPIQKDEESCHLLNYLSIDNLGNINVADPNCFFVDSTPPAITKEVGEPKVQIPETDNYYITKDTEITLSCEDQEPHPSGDVIINYKYRVNEGEGFGDWSDTISEQTSEVVFSFPETSIHELEYWCTDAVGNESEHGTETDYVDNEPPIITKEMIGTGHLGYRDGVLNEAACPPVPGNEDVCFVADNGENGVSISAEDTQANHMVDNVTCFYQVWWHTSEEICNEYQGRYDGDSGRCLIDGDEFSDYTEVIFTEDSTHDLEITCHDGLGNSVEDIEQFKVDSNPPETTKTLGPDGTWYVNEETGAEYIDTATRITLEAEDAKVGVDETYYRISGSLGDQFCASQQACAGWMTALRPAMGEWNTYSEPFPIEEQSCHVIEYRSVDLLGNEEEIGWQCVFVDKTGPIVTTENPEGTIADSGEPLFTTENNPDGNFNWITSSMPIRISCEDQEPHPSGVRELGFRVSYDYPEWDYITGKYCEDEISGDEWCIASLDDRGGFTFNFNAEEDSLHNLEYYCIDNVGKTSEEQIQYYKVDNEPPVVDKILEGPSVGDCSPEATQSIENDCMVDTATRIYLEYEDGGEICHVDGVNCNWRYEVGEEGFPRELESQWMDYNALEGINFPEESYHTLEVACEDALGNAWEDTEYFQVDKTPPVTTKEYGEPIYPNGESHPKWITSDTNISLSASDEYGPHVSDVNKTYYRVTIVDDQYCEYNLRAVALEVPEPDAFDCRDAEGTGEFLEYEGTFTIPEDSCHLIEYYSVDNVGKTESVNKQCTYVDNQGPTPIKTVGQPSETWTPGENDDPLSIYYPEINDLCWADGNNSIDCWQVTLLTPVSMSCADPEPHPVNHSKIYFKVDFDGDNATEGYCGKYDGTITEDGWCYADTDNLTVYFSEESEHNLKYYCEDALGNTGPVDDEKFKVEGTAFRIELNKKWNLVSVPFVLQDNNITKVLENGIVNDLTNVEAVWTYDSILGWQVYRPNNQDTGNLDTMDPGRGYWISMLNEDVLLIGGALFSPAQTPPTWPIVPGWNLIGYYGNDSLITNSEKAGYEPPEFEAKEVYDGPDMEGRAAGCALYSLGDSKEDKGWTGLTGYWQPYNEDGDPNTNVLQVYGYPDRLDSGAGYWLSTSETGLYEFTTTCGTI
ncbi:MAG: hypothetical protein NUV57_03240 [archaeon]|nr:hypothetical protein [archaeon]